MDKYIIKRNIDQLVEELQNEPGLYHKFLNSAVYTYRFSLENQLALFSQDRNVRLVASKNYWEKVHRTVNSDANPLYLVDPSDHNQGDTVFTQRDTQGAQPPSWRTRWVDQQKVLQKLNLQNQTQDRSIEQALESTLRNFERDLDGLFQSIVLPYCRENDISIETYRSYCGNASRLIRNGVAYVLYVRTGFHVPKKYQDLDATSFELLPDRSITIELCKSAQITTKEALDFFRESVVGIAVHKENRYNGITHNEHQFVEVERGGHHESGAIRKGSRRTSERIGARRSDRGIRQSESKPDVRGEQLSISGDAARRDTQTLSPGSGPESQRHLEQHIRQDEGPSTETERATEPERRLSGIRGSHRGDQQSGERNRPGLRSQRHEVQGLPDERGSLTNNHQEKQLSLFGAESTDVLSASSTSSEKTTPDAKPSIQTVVTQAILLPEYNSEDRKRIAVLEMEKLKNPELYSGSPATDILRERAGKFGFGFFVADNPYTVWFAEDEIHLAEGDHAEFNPNAFKLSYDEAGKIITQLIQEGQYLSEQESSELDEFARQSIAEDFWYAHQDFTQELAYSLSEESKNTLSLIYQKHGFPESTKRMSELLKDKEFQESIEKINGEIQRFMLRDTAAFRSRISLRHFQAERSLLKGYQSFEIIPSNDPLSPVSDLFISQDEIDHAILRSLGNIEHGFESIFPLYLQQDIDKINRRKELIELIGNSGYYPADHGIAFDCFNNKITIIHGEGIETVLSYTQADKRLEKLVSDNQLSLIRKASASFAARAQTQPDHETGGPEIIQDQQDEVASENSTADSQNLPTHEEAQETQPDHETGGPEITQNQQDEVASESSTTDPQNPPIHEEAQEQSSDTENKGESVSDEIITSEPDATQISEVPSDYVITADNIGEGTQREKLNANRKAIATIRQLESENDRPADKEEQEILAQYVGWGGLADAFDPGKPLYDENLKENLLTPEEYESAKKSTLNAFFTAPVIIRSIYNILSRNGFQGGNILEPSCGVGNFFGMMPEEMRRNSQLHGVELDPMSAKIARKLYPSVTIMQQGFEKSVFSPDSFDIAIGNVPFGDYSLSDPKYNRLHLQIHDYFFAKSLDLVRPGGVVAFITSSGTLDKKNPSFRKYLADRANLIGALRLPNTAFLKNAGTSVTSDIILLQKKDEISPSSAEWINLSEDANGLTYNSYFVSHPEMVVGEMKQVSGPFGPTNACILPEGSSFESLLNAASNQIQFEYEQRRITEPPHQEQTPDLLDVSKIPNYTFAQIGENVYFNENGTITKCKHEGKRLERIKGMIKIRDAAWKVVQIQTDDGSEEELAAAQKELNEVYDAFYAEYGGLNQKANSNLFSPDAGSSLILSLENTDEDNNVLSKSDMFFERTIRMHVPVTHVDTASEALAISLSEHGMVDLAYMEQLTGLDASRIISDLHTVIYHDTTRADLDHPETIDLNHLPLVTADEYLSGNVRRKLHQIDAIIEKRPELKEQLADAKHAMQEAIPADLSAAEIDVRLGSSWVPVNIYKDFIDDLLQLKDHYWYRPNTVEVEYVEATNEWNITGRAYFKNSTLARETYGTEDADAGRLILDALNMRSTKITEIITDDSGKEVRRTNPEKTQAAIEKQNKIKQAFKDWVFKDPERRELLVNLYNERFNCIHPREYSGKELVFPGMNKTIDLRPHQRRAVARQIFGGNTLLAHCVGAGKTFEIVTAIMEKKRLGLCTKAMIAVPNHLTEQWASDFLKLYPAAKVLAVTKKDFTKVNRQRFCTRIATGNYDAVIIGHSQFEKIPVSSERQEAFIQKQLTALEEELTRMDINPQSRFSRRFTIKQMESQKARLQSKLDTLLSKPRDNAITFEQLGIDFLCVDEAHHFKNLSFPTHMSNVAGISTTGSMKSEDMLMKCRYMDEITGGKGITFATGTPVSNSMTELYTMQRYLQNDALEKIGLSAFDSWASTFGETNTSWEMTPDATSFHQKTRFSKFFNMPELMSIFKETADIQTADMLHLPVPEVETVIEQIEPSPLQQRIIKNLGERADRVHNRLVTPDIDNMLKITSDGRKLALDERLIADIDESISEDELKKYCGRKVQRCIENCLDVYRESSENKGTQLVFCDLSTPKKDGSFTIYSEIKAGLIEGGVSEEEIAYIHNANSDEQKKTLFQKVRSGQVRILIGSTSKMGAGMNVQDRLIALHHLDVPWKPSDIEQREGRIIRQGNLNEKVKVFRYVTKGTFDAYSWQILENKQKFISQIMTSKSPARSCGDLDEAVLSFAETKALCTGNEDLRKYIELENAVHLKSNEREQFYKNLYRNQDDVRVRYPKMIQDLKTEIKGYEEDAAYLLNNPLPDEKHFNIYIKGVGTCTERKTANSKLFVMANSVTFGREEEIGEYNGFKIYANASFMSKPMLYLKRSGNHEVSVGTNMLVRIGNVLNPDYLKKEESLKRQQLESTEMDLKTKKEEIKNSTYPEEKELNDMKLELEKLQSKIQEKSSNPETEQPSIIDDGNTFVSPVEVDFSNKEASVDIDMD